MLGIGCPNRHVLPLIPSPSENQRFTSPLPRERVRSLPLNRRSPSSTEPVQCQRDRDSRACSHSVTRDRFSAGATTICRNCTSYGKNISQRGITMCRNIKTLHNFRPPATDDEIRASALQFVRKLSGFTRPSKANQLAFERAVDEVARTARELLDALVTGAPPRNRDDEAAKARAKAAERYRPVANATT